MGNYVHLRVLVCAGVRPNDSAASCSHTKMAHFAAAGPQNTPAESHQTAFKRRTNLRAPACFFTNAESRGDKVHKQVHASGSVHVCCARVCAFIFSWKFIYLLAAGPRQSDSGVNFKL